MTRGDEEVKSTQVVMIFCERYLECRGRMYSQIPLSEVQKFWQADIYITHWGKFTEQNVAEVGLKLHQIVHFRLFYLFFYLQIQFLKGMRIRRF